jgi:hypothetical protein
MVQHVWMSGKGHFLPLANFMFAAVLSDLLDPIQHLEACGWLSLSAVTCAYKPA